MNSDFLSFRCTTCDIRFVDEYVSFVAQLMTLDAYGLRWLQGPERNEKGLPVAGGLYTTKLRFPFHGRTDRPARFYAFDPLPYWIEAEFTAIGDRDEESAEVELFVNEVCAGQELARGLPPISVAIEDLDSYLDIDPPGRHEMGEGLVIYMSESQDGGNWFVMDENDPTDPAIVFAGEGFHGHIQDFIGNLRPGAAALESLRRLFA